MTQPMNRDADILAGQAQIKTQITNLPPQVIKSIAQAIDETVEDEGGISDEYLTEIVRARLWPSTHRKY